MTQPVSTTELRLEDLDWLRALARRLVADPHRADDAVQDTVLVALEKRPARSAAFRGWLGSILKNRVKQERRDRSRREAREATRTADTSPSTLEVVAELSIQRELVEQVQALPEPYRSTIVLRFLRGHTPREIARDAELPVKTVHTRIERGVAKLRDRLDRRHGGDRRAWVTLLSPLANHGRGLTMGALGSLVIPMNTKLLATAVSTLVVCALVWVPFSGSDEVVSPSSGQEPRGDVSVAAAAAETSPGPQRERVGPDPGRAEPETVDATRTQIEGEVRQLDGTTVADVFVVFERRQGDRFLGGPDAPRAKSSAGGRFALSIPPTSGRLVVEDDGFACVTRPHLTDRRPLEPPIVVVAPSRSYSGRVVDRHGQPLAHATVEASIDGSFARSLDTSRIGGRTVHLSLPFAEMRTTGGRFEFDRIGYLPGLYIEAECDGYRPAKVEVTDASSDHLEIVLDAEMPKERAIFGAVLGPGGVPVPRAFVSVGQRSVETDANGEFALELSKWFKKGAVIAVQNGRLPATQEFEWKPGALGTHRDRPIVLTLTGQPQRIAGRVVDRDGDPVSGAVVWTPHTTDFGQMAYDMQGKSVTGSMTVEQVLSGRVRGDPTQRIVRATTDASGQFELTGLQRKEYAVMALVPGSLASVKPVSIAAGEASIVLRLAEEPLRRVAGRVVSRSGQPIAGLKIALGRSLDWRRPPEPQRGPMRPPSPTMILRGGDPVHTDAEGRFEFAALCPTRAFFNLTGSAIVLSKSYRLAEATDLQNCEIVVDVSSRFRIVLASDPTEADRFELVPGGKPSRILFVEIETHTISAQHVEIVDGRSGVAMVHAGEGEIWLVKDGKRVRRVHVTFRPGGVHEIRL